MKLVFSTHAEQKEIMEIVTNASSVSNSRSLMDLVKDSIVDGSEPEPKAAEKAPEKVGQESMEDLITRAKGLGIVVTDDDSRAGILQKIEAVDKKPADTKEDADVGDKSSTKKTTKKGSKK